MEITCPRCGINNQDESEYCSSCEFPLAEAALLVHGKYRMSRPYIFSTFRAVYEAEDISDNNRKYSVREFLPCLVSSGEKISIRSQFEVLMRKYQDLRHPNLAGISDFFIDGNYYYVLYDYVNGQDITKYMASHRIIYGTGYPEALVVHWITQICDLIHYLHHSQDNPIYLVDFKPHAVVFRQEDEKLVFIDLGISRILGMLGPHYLITEDFQAFRKAGGRAESVGWDLFCLGNFIYYLLTGVDLLKWSDKKFPPLKAGRPDISFAMNEIVTKALGQNYRSGYGDIEEIIQDLQELHQFPLQAFDFYHDFVKEKEQKIKTSWKMLLGNEARTNAVSMPPRVPIRVKWTAKTKESSRFFLSTSDDRIYAATREGMVYSLNKDTGEQDWVFPICRQLTNEGISCDGILYYITPLNEMVAVERGATSFLWKLPLEGSSMASPFLQDDIIFAALYNGTIYAVSAEEGSILTKYKIEGNILSCPVIHNNILYVASLNKMMCAIDVDTEEEIWHYESEEGFSASPTLSENRLFIGSHNGTLSAVDIQSGELIWSRNFKGVITQSVRAAHHVIFIVTRDGELLALSPDKGETMWKIKLGVREDQYPFAMGTNTLFVVDSQNNLCTYDSFTGNLRHKLKMSHTVVSQLMIAHNQLYLASETGHIAAFGK